jgi:hypothetical protein
MEIWRTILFRKLYSAEGNRGSRVCPNISWIIRALNKARLSALEHFIIGRNKPRQLRSILFIAVVRVIELAAKKKGKTYRAVRR